MILLEHTAGQGTALGATFEQLASIIQGCLGLEPFRRILNDRRFRAVPMLLETPKEEGHSAMKIEIDRFDERNLATLRGLIELRTQK